MGSRAAALAVGLGILLSGCSAEATSEDPGQSASEAASATPDSAKPSLAGPSLPAGEVVQASKGEYLQSTITVDDPAMRYLPSRSTGNPEEHFSAEQLQKAQEFSSRFIAEEVIDSPLNNNPDGEVNGWWENHKNLLDPAWQESYYDELLSGGMLLRSAWQTDFETDGFKIDYVYSTEETRFSDRNLDIKEFYYSDGLLVIKTDWDATAKVPLPDGVGTETTYGYYSLGLTPTDQNEYGWMISHYEWKTTGRDLSESLQKTIEAHYDPPQKPGTDD